MTASHAIDGRAIAQTILTTLQTDVQRLKQKGITPTLVAIVIGDDPSSLSYIRQKQKAAEAIGAQVTVAQFPTTIPDEAFKSALLGYNNDPSVHGIIIQRPLPKESSILPASLSLVEPNKDVDGFVEHSQFDVPVAKAVMLILEQIFSDRFSADRDFLHWLQTQTVVVIGKGVTAGRPIIQTLENRSVPVVVIDRTVQDTARLIQTADILISCVGKPHLLQAAYLKQDVILLGVGMARGDDGLLHGDYEDADIQQKASYYTPTPGGIGPVNVACLMQNLVKGCTMSLHE